MLKKTKGRSEQMWSGVVVVVVVGMLVGVYFLRLSQGDFINTNIRPSLLPPKSQAQVIKDTSLEIYENSIHNFKVNYPKSWQATMSSTGEGESEIFSLSLVGEGNDIGISVMSEDMEGIVRNSISVNKESKIEVNGVSAQKLEGGSMKDGSSVTMVLIKGQDRLYSIEGTGQEFNQIVSYFELLEL